MDRTFKGLIAGTISAVFMNAINLIFFYIFNLTKVRFLDWASIIMLGSKATTLPAAIYALIIHIFWTGALGIIFSYLLPEITSQGYLIKGGLYAFLLTFIFRAIVKLYNISFLSPISFQTSLTNTTSAFLWGITLAFLLKKLD